MIPKNEVVKRETPRHAEAFEYYYSLGDNRSWEKVADEFNVSVTSIQRWNDSFNWQARVEIRNNEINKAIEARSKKENVDKRARMIHSVDGLLGLFDQALKKNLADIEKKLIEFDQLTNPQQFNSFSQAYDRAISLRMKLTGEVKDTPIAEGTIVRFYMPKRDEDE